MKRSHTRQSLFDDFTVLPLIRHLEWHDTRGHQDSEAWHYVSRGLPAGSAGDEETPPREAGAALRRCLRGAHLHRH